MIPILRKYGRFSPDERRLLHEAIYHLGKARFALCFSFSKLADRLGSKSEASLCEPLSPEQEAQALAIALAINRAVPYLPWSSQCLVQATAGKWMCDRRHLPTTLYLGVGKETSGEPGLAAHAWLRAGSHILLGADHAADYKTIICFN